VYKPDHKIQDRRELQPASEFGQSEGFCVAKKPPDARTKADRWRPAAPEARLGKAGERVQLLSIDDLDRRKSSWQRTRALLEALEAETSTWSTGKKQLAMRAAVHGAMLQDFEVRYLRGEEVDWSVYVLLTNSQRRLIGEIYSPALQSQLKQVDAIEEAFMEGWNEAAE
jgi:hypothetical protein